MDRINGYAIKVHNTLGNGFQEVIYKRYLAIELEKEGLNLGKEKIGEPKDEASLLEK